MLDLATGTGALALQLARRSRRVVGVDRAPAMLEAAHVRATELGLPLVLRAACATAATERGERYAVVTVSEAFHRLGGLPAARAVYRALCPEGFFFVVLGKRRYPEAHPLRALAPRLKGEAAALFEGLDRHLDWLTRTFAASAPAGEEPLAPVESWLYAWRRPLDLGFLRAFFDDASLARLVGASPPWPLVERALAAASPEDLLGEELFALWRFERCGAGREPLRRTTREALEVPFVEPST
ncbi:MAG: class I SAM-dependent methyltransferase [Deltaproteobacteria bacterium]|nr:class I SAM-dependent methyltransferase [Deltaproteobacteria bacterium]